MLVWYYERNSFLVDLKSSCFLELTLWYPILSSRVNLAIFRHYVLLKKDNNSIFFLFCFVSFYIDLFICYFSSSWKKEKRKRWSGRVSIHWKLCAITASFQLRLTSLYKSFTFPSFMSISCCLSRLHLRQKQKHWKEERKPNSRLETRLKGTGMGSYELYVWILMALRNDHSFKELSFKMKEECKSKWSISSALFNSLIYLVNRLWARDLFGVIVNEGESRIMEIKSK